LPTSSAALAIADVAKAQQKLYINGIGGDDGSSPGKEQMQQVKKP